MDRIIQYFRANKTFLSMGFLWLLVWIIPWGKILVVDGNLYSIFIVDLVKLCVALVIFISPGALLFILLRHKNDSLVDQWGILPIGFTLSVTIIAVIGLSGRIFGFSFVLVKNIFMLIGLVELFLLTYFKPDFSIRKEYILESFRSILNNPPLLLALVLATLMTFNDYLFFIDDTTYLAYMTNWQHATHLNFNNIIHQMDIMEIERFWLAMYPMGQAFLSDLSGVPGILLFSNYLELFLIPIAVITSYWFGRTLGVSRRAAGFSVLIQISLYTWMVGEQWPVGFWFFLNLVEDKVSAVFLLAPVFFALVLRFIQHPNKKNIILVFLSGISLTLTHPVILFFACVIASGLGLFSWIAKRVSWREILQLAIVVVSLMIPYATIRHYSTSFGFSLDAKSASVSYQIDRYTNVINDIFYGLNPGVLKFFDLPPESSAYNAYQFIRSFPFVLVLVAGILALVNLKKGPLYWYILSCVLLVVFATVPYTGWILGYFAGARLISRASWFSPLGLAGALVLTPLADWLKSSRIVKSKERNYTYKLRNGTFWGLVLCFVFASPMLVVGSISRAPFYFEVLNHNKQLAQIGTYIDQNTTSPVTVIALDYPDIQMLPGVSAHTSLISFREEKDDNGHNFTFSVDEIHERIYASNTIRSLEQEIRYEERCSLIEKFDVKFVVAQSKDVERYKSIIDNCVRVIKIVYETKEMVLLELK